MCEYENVGIGVSVQSLEYIFTFSHPHIRTLFLYLADLL